MATKALKWSRPARERLLDIGMYIAQQSPQNAKKVVRAIREKAREIPPHPEAFPVVQQLPNKHHAYRFAMVYKYKIIYKIRETDILILDIFHASRDPRRIEPLGEEE